MELHAINPRALDIVNCGGRVGVIWNVGLDPTRPILHIHVKLSDIVPSTYGPELFAALTAGNKSFMSYTSTELYVNHDMVKFEWQQWPVALLELPIKSPRDTRTHTWRWHPLRGFEALTGAGTTETDG